MIERRKGEDDGPIEKDRARKKAVKRLRLKLNLAVHNHQSTINNHQSETEPFEITRVIVSYRRYPEFELYIRSSMLYRLDRLLPDLISFNRQLTGLSPHCHEDQPGFGIKVLKDCQRTTDHRQLTNL
jgi:hypothetical protein